MWTLCSLLAHAVCSCARAKSSVLLIQMFEVRNWSHWKLTFPPPPFFSWLLAGSDLWCVSCAITQRVVPASGEWEARSGLLLLVAVTPVGLTVKLEHRLTWTTTQSKRKTSIYRLSHAAGSSRSRQTPIRFCMAEEIPSHKHLRARSNCFEMDWRRTLRVPTAAIHEPLAKTREDHAEWWVWRNCTNPSGPALPYGFSVPPSYKQGPLCFGDLSMAPAW